MTARRLALFPLLLLTLAAAPALAQDDEEEEEAAADTPAQEDPEPEVASRSAWDRWLAASITGGVDTPLGVAGAAIEITPFRYLSIYAGAGVAREGVRFGGGLRGQFPIDNAALGLMLGFTGGPMDWDSQTRDNTNSHRYWEMALFFHIGLTFEYRWEEGFFGRLAFGVETLVTPGEATSCSYDGGTDCTGASLATPIRGWAGLTVGYAFDL